MSYKDPFMKCPDCDLVFSTENENGELIKHLINDHHIPEISLPELKTVLKETFGKWERQLLEKKAYEARN